MAHAHTQNAMETHARESDVQPGTSTMEAQSSMQINDFREALTPDEALDLRYVRHH